MQHAVSTTIEEEIFSTWFAYIHCWATGVFSMDLPQDYISGTESNQIRMKRMRRTRTERVLSNHLLRVIVLIVIMNDCTRRCY
jgi:hypothetical protein